MINKYNQLLAFLFIIICVSCNKKEDKKLIEKEIISPEIVTSFDIPLTDSIYDVKQEYKDNVPVFPWTNGNIEKYDHFVLDKNGIPLFEYEGKLDYFPGSYIQVASTYYASYKETKSEDSKNKFMNIANFCYNNLTEIKDFSVLNTKTLVNGYDLKSPWPSALVNGFAISVMLQAYDITKDKKYLIASQKMVRAYNTTIEEGGVLSYWDKVPYYEEYADPKSHVLNGFMFSLVGLYYSYKVTGNLEAKALFYQGMGSLASKLREFDAGFTSNYNKLKVNTKEEVMETYASALNEDPDHYLELEIYQLLSLYNWTGQYFLRDYAHRFLKYDTGIVDGMYDKPKYESITASHTIDPVNYGIEHLNNELWSWGNYWSTDKVGTEIVVEFGKERQNIEAVVFYAAGEDFMPDNFDVYVFQNEWVKVASSLQIRKTLSNSILADNGDKTNVKVYYLNKKQTGTALKVVFNNLGKNKAIALREFNILFDRWEELEIIRAALDKYTIN